MGGAPVGNQNAVKFKTSEERQALCQLYCDHMVKGLSKECFVPCDMQTFKKLVESYPVDFDTEKITQAEREGRLHWEDMGEVMAVAGQGNSAVWIFNMKNRYKWKDRHDMTSDDKELKGLVSVDYGDKED